MTQRFKLGQVVMTRGVNDLVADNSEFAEFVMDCIGRHANGDWGDMDPEDKKRNEEALNTGLRLFSAYKDDRFPQHGVATIWIITEADRSATTVLFPDEY